MLLLGPACCTVHAGEAGSGLQSAANKTVPANHRQTELGCSMYCEQGSTTEAKTATFAGAQLAQIMNLARAGAEVQAATVWPDHYPSPQRGSLAVRTSACPG